MGKGKNSKNKDKMKSTMPPSEPKEELLDPDFLDSICDVDVITLRMDDEDELAAYEELVRGLRKACCGRVVEVESLKDILTTLPDANPKVTIIHAKGYFEFADVDLKLMVIKKTVYVQAIRRPDGWYEVTDSHMKIKDAKSLFFGGAYTGMTGDGGLSVENMKLGFKNLKRAIVKLFYGKGDVTDFLTIAVNLCEAARYDIIKKQIVEKIGVYEDDECCFICPLGIFLIGGWDKLTVCGELT